MVGMYFLWYCLEKKKKKKINTSSNAKLSGGGEVLNTHQQICL